MLRPIPARLMISLHPAWKTVSPLTRRNFSRLSALKPARPAAARPAALRAPDEEDTLARLLGAGVAKNLFGEYLSIRNWFSTPEFSEPSSTSLDLLSRARDE